MRGLAEKLCSGLPDMEVGTRPALSTEQQKTHSSLVAFDLMRGLASTAVLLFHVRGSVFFEYTSFAPNERTTLVTILFGLTRLGPEAVLVFFVLSGFLVGGQIIERTKNGTFKLVPYAIDRCTRIFLPLIPACLLTALITLLVFNETTDPFSIVANMIGMNGIFASTLNRNPPLWSISYEIWFYIVGGAIGYLAVKEKCVWTMIVLGISTVIFTILNTPFLLYWAFGAMMVPCLNVRYKGSLFVTGVVLAALGTVFYELSSLNNLIATPPVIPIEVSRALLCIGVSVSLPFLCSQYVDRSLEYLRRPASALAAYSYTLYLVHYPVNLSLDKMFPKFGALTWESMWYFGARIAICSAAATFLYYCFERNTPALRRWLIARLN
jgi:peptidoglycan/LPS O-acetylase OafA/YrhL